MRVSSSVCLSGLSVRPERQKQWSKLGEGGKRKESFLFLGRFLRLPSLSKNFPDKEKMMIRLSNFSVLSLSGSECTQSKSSPRWWSTAQAGKRKKLFCPSFRSLSKVLFLCLSCTFFFFVEAFSGFFEGTDRSNFDVSSRQAISWRRRRRSLKIRNWSFFLFISESKE